MTSFTLSVKNGLSKAFNLSILEKKRMAWVDYLRGIAIILVVYRHVLIGLQRSNLRIPTALVTANMIFFSFRMPLFFILSGIFVSGSIARRTVKQLLFIKFENLLYPYLIWAFLQVTLQIVFARFTNSDRSLIDYTYILYQPRSLDQFWYLPALFNTTVIYILIKAKWKAPGWSQILLGIALYMLSPYCQKISMMSDWMEFYIFFALGDTISTLFFHEKTQRFLQNPWTLLAVIPVFIAAQLYYLGYFGRSNISQLEFLVIALIGCFSMFVLSFRMQSWGFFPFLRVLGFHSLFIYVMHVIISAFVRLFLTRVLGLHNPTALLFCGIAAGVTIPVIIYNLCIKDKPGWFLFSLKRPEKTPRAVAA
jgi:fucose 4-O-acetylase-like acetyltransferase